VSTPAPPGEPTCPRCGAPHSANQEYCLECGYRLQPRGGLLGGLSAAWQQRFGWYPGDWVWPVLLGFLIAAAGAAAAIVLADAGAQNGTIVATEGGPAHAPTTSPVTTTVELPSVPTGTPTGPPSTPTAPPPATTTAPRPGALTAWPAGQSGFTVVLESIPAKAGRSLAVARARDASLAGLPQVGVLESSRYSSLHPGYYVVFSGIYSSRPEADRARAAAAAKGFGNAYAREITR
jgi:zinc ribbon protein